MASEQAERCIGKCMCNPDHRTSGFTRADASKTALTPSSHRMLDSTEFARENIEVLVFCEEKPRCMIDVEAARLEKHACEHRSRWVENESVMQSMLHSATRDLPQQCLLCCHQCCRIQLSFIASWTRWSTRRAKDATRQAIAERRIGLHRVGFSNITAAFVAALLPVPSGVDSGLPCQGTT